MTTPPPARPRSLADIDRDIDACRRDRGRLLVQVDQYLKAISGLRGKYARAGDAIDELLEERQLLRTRVASES